MVLSVAVVGCLNTEHIWTSSHKWESRRFVLVILGLYIDILLCWLILDVLSRIRSNLLELRLFECWVLYLSQGFALDLVIVKKFKGPKGIFAVVVEGHLGGTLARVVGRLRCLMSGGQWPK